MCKNLKEFCKSFKRNFVKFPKKKKNQLQDHLPTKSEYQAQTQPNSREGVWGLLLQVEA
jgi:hypothetical protein